MPGTDDVVWSIKPHTVAKHQILEEYLKRWLPILGGTVPRLVYLDGFAGPGVYAGGEPGSPVIALKTAKEHSLAHRFKKIVFWFMEDDPERAETLKKTLQDEFPNLPGKFQYSVETSKFAAGLNDTLDKIESGGENLAPTLAFIDPFGFSGIPMELVKRMLGYEKCEVLITFMSSYVLRFHDDRRARALDELYGTTEWRKIDDIADRKEKERFVVDLYVRQLEKAGAKFHRTFEMIGGNNQLLYHLVFATTHIAGLEAMKEAMVKVDRRRTFRISDRTDPRQTLLLDYSTDAWILDAARAVHEKFAGRKTLITAVRKFVLTETPYLFRKSILKRLEQEGKIAEVTGRKRNFTYPDLCFITFS